MLQKIYVKKRKEDLIRRNKPHSPLALSPLVQPTVYHCSSFSYYRHSQPRRENEKTRA
jgi:hypothetical protein